MRLGGQPGEHLGQLFRLSVCQVDNLDVPCPLGSGLIQGFDQGLDHLRVLAVGQDDKHIDPLIREDSQRRSGPSPLDLFQFGLQQP